MSERGLQAGRFVRRLAGGGETVLPQPRCFSREIRRVTRLIGRHPESGHLAYDVQLEGVRRVLLVATHHYLYYYVNVTDDRIDVLAVWSTHRGDAPPI